MLEVRVEMNDEDAELTAEWEETRYESPGGLERMYELLDSRIPEREPYAHIYIIDSEVM